MSEAMPKQSQYKPLKEVKTLDDAIDHPEVVRRFQNALGDKLDAVQYLSTIRGMARENPVFTRVDVWELVRCALDLAELGLRPNTPFGHAWIIPRVMFKDTPREKVTLSVQIGAQGLLELAFRAGTLESIHAEVVFEGDEFTYEYGSKSHLRHVPRGSQRNRTPTHAYAYATLRGGGEAFVVWDFADVLYIRDNSDAYKYAVSQGEKSKTYLQAPWIANLPSMARKTMLKQLLKVIPKSAEFLVRADYIDGLAEAGKLSYEGRAGDLNIGPRELTYAPSATLHDLGFKASPTVNGEADTVAASVKKTEPAKQAKTTEEAKLKVVQSDLEASNANLVIDDTHLLISADGDILAQVGIVEWAAKFVEHLEDVPQDYKQAYEEHNWDALQAAIDDPRTAPVMAAAGWSRDDGNRDEDQSKGTETVDLRLVIPEGRISAKEIQGIIDQSLAQTTKDTLASWRAINTPILNGMSTQYKVMGLQRMAARAKDLGIPMAQN